MINFKKKIVVTSALPYANGDLHLGHLVEYIQTDIFVRFLKLVGEDAIYCCADDTHGTPIEIKATELGIKPEELIEKVYKEHLEDFHAFHIEFDSYYSTNSPENKHYADQIFLALKEKGLIYTKEVESFYDEKSKRFLPDRYVKGECPKCGEKDQYGDVCEHCNETYKPIDLINPYSTVSGSTPVRKTSVHYFFKLSSLSEKLDKWLTENKRLQKEIVNYIRNWIKEGLQDWDISRDGPYFGFKIPGEENKFYYVWLDAPIGYIASTQNYCKSKGLDAEKEYWKSKHSEIIHFIGKDIMYFHFLFWPAMLMESGFNLPDNIAVHGFLTVNGEKMSKSRGTFFTARDFLKLYNPEYLRFYYAKILSSKLSDIDLNFNDLKDSVNNELVANIGNFCNRVLTFINKNFDGEIKEIDQNQALIDEVLKKAEEIKNNYRSLDFNIVIKDILSISSIGNKYFQDNEPWKLIKTDKEKTRKILAASINVAKILSIVIAPILPAFSEKLKNQLNLKKLTWDDINFDTKKHKVNSAEILVNKMEIVEKEKFPLQLRVAKILEANDHPDAEKLFVLKIDLGSEQRQLVAGLRQYYKKEDLIGKKIIIVANLKPAKLRGYESKGMLLAADDKVNVGLLFVTEGNPGEVVKVEGKDINTQIIDYDEFSKTKINVVDGKVICENNILKVGNEEVKVDKGIMSGSVK